MNRYAVIGTTGFLGRTFFEKSHPDFELLPVDRKLADLTKPFERHLGDYFKRNGKIEAAIICAAISSPDDCKTQHLGEWSQDSH